MTRLAAEAPSARRAQAGARGTASAPIDLPREGEDDKDCVVTLAGLKLYVDPAGALYWPDERLLVVADLHLEKGSAFAKRGVLLPPYDTAATLTRLARLVEHYRPRLVVALGDSFHDGGGPSRMEAADKTMLKKLQHRREWVWIAGNHDPEIAGVGGRFAETLALGPLTFRHEPSADNSPARLPAELSAEGSWRNVSGPSASVSAKRPPTPAISGS